MPKGSCKLTSKCTEKPCKGDVYFLHGYDEPIETFRFRQFDDMNLPHHKTFKCHLPHRDCKYDPDCITNAFHEEKRRHSGRKPVSMVGISLGGMMSQLYSNKHPKEVNKLGLVQSFVELNEWYRDMRRIFEPEHVSNIEKRDYRLKDNRKARVFIYNCIPDAFVIGLPPQLKGAKVENEFICLHGYVPDQIREGIENFLNE